jgi:putative endonuclease
LGRGSRAEEAVADYLVARGFDVIARNVRFGALEIDLVARKGDLAVAVEVRTRGPGSFVGALGSVDETKRKRIVRACERLWQRTLSKVDGIARMRIDVAAVHFDGATTRVDYIEAAITA